MIDTDPKLLKILKALEQRPDISHTAMAQAAITYLKTAPAVPRRSAALIAMRGVLSDARTKMMTSKVLIEAELFLFRGAKADLIDYLNSKYRNFLDGVRNQSGRDSMVARATSPLTKRIRKMESSLSTIENAIKDYDARAFAVRDVIEAMKLGEREI